MKTRNWMLTAIAVLATAFSLQSCLNEDDNSHLRMPNALVTLKNNAAQGFYLQLDDKTIVKPTNITKSPYGTKELRAFVNLKFDDKDKDKMERAAYVNWIDTILTKPMAKNLGEKNDATYGNDPIEIVKDWATILEDGYLTLRFRTYFGDPKKTHMINLIPTGKPYEVELRHNANGDKAGFVGDGCVAFRLSDLPDTGDKEVELTIKWKSFSGDKSAKFKYKTRK